MSIDRGTDKENVVHIHNRILLSHKKELFQKIAEMWMGLETVIQSEVRKRKTNIMRSEEQHV